MISQSRCAAGDRVLCTKRLNPSTLMWECPERTSRLLFVAEVDNTDRN